MTNRDYALDAHSTNYHGRDGKAVGAKLDNKGPFDWKQPTNEESGVTVAQDTDGAAHLPRAGAAHKFAQPPAPGAHGFGHPVSQRTGPLRHSGHKGAHRVGKR
jgi:hypothetical protein